MQFQLSPTPVPVERILREALNPALAALTSKAPAKLYTPEGKLLTLAIGYQESKYKDRVQKGGGPAHGFLQNEKGGGIKGVMTHSASRDLAAELCNRREVIPQIDAVYAAVVEDDLLALGLGRLLLWTDAQTMPKIGDVDIAWEYYLRVWRPGKPRKNDWPESYTLARRAIEGG